MTDVSEKIYQFTVFTLVELTDAMRMISDQAMKHNGNTSAESQFLVIANGLSQLDASVNGIGREMVYLFEKYDNVSHRIGGRCAYAYQFP